jgi:SAM-dependent methyltransferase
LNVTGSDIRNFECPWCGAHDRERHLYLYLSESGVFNNIKGWRILHFAPEKRLSTLIQEQSPFEYLKCDLYPTDHDVIKVDIQEIPYNSEYFDLVIVNHVLEHVSRDDLALSEISRILKSGGLAILQTPYSPVLNETWADEGITDPLTRREAFGQDDHVRLYGKDIIKRICKYGFESLVKSHDDLLSDFDPSLYGVNGDEPFFLFKKEE